MHCKNEHRNNGYNLWLIKVKVDKHYTLQFSLNNLNKSTIYCFFTYHFEIDNLLLKNILKSPKQCPQLYSYSSCWGARVEQEVDGRLFSQTFSEHINSCFGTWLQHAKLFCRALPPVSTAEEYLRWRGTLAATILPFWTAIWMPPRRRTPTLSLLDTAFFTATQPAAGDSVSVSPTLGSSCHNK